MGHIHIGYDNPNQKTSEQIVYAMDAILGLESILLDKDDRRKEMYGKAGCFRFKKYGVEYRTLSNFWIKDNESIAWAYNKTVEAVELVNTGIIETIIAQFETKIKNAIDNNDKYESKSLLKEIELVKQNELVKK